MKKMGWFFCSIFLANVGFADSLVLNNQAANSTNNKKSRIAIQWANSAKEIAENNNKLKQGITFNSNSLQSLTKIGKIQLDIPKNAEYFRVLVWSNGVNKPDLLTNWVDIIPNKIYTLNEDQLTPVALMSGMGC